MARMSIDDMVARDPRITTLCQILNWSRREVVGCLVLDVWPICYDQVTHLVSERMIDSAAKHPGFAKAMIECELARRDRSGKLRVSGAKERVKYIKNKAGAGREGGLKSGISRRKSTKQNAKQPEAAGNPSAPDPASAPDPVSASASDPVSVGVPEPRERARDLPVELPFQIPENWQPTLEHELAANRTDLDFDFERDRFRTNARTNGRRVSDWNAAFDAWLLDSTQRKKSKSSSSNTSDAILRIARGEQP